MQIKTNYKKHSWFIGILKEFQWFGIMLSTDNPTYGGNKYFLFEFRLLWLRVWYVYEFESF
jgi:hypothetical protein